MAAEDIWLCVFTKDRLPLTRRCMEAVLAERPGRLKLMVIDVGSTDGTVDYLKAEHDEGLIDEVLLNAPGALPQWQKNAAIAEFAEFLAGTEHAFAGWLDNDVVLKRGWLHAALCVLDVGPGDMEVVSLFNDAEQERVHPTVRTVEVAGRTLRLKRSANGAAWLFRQGFFARHGLPPVGRGITQETVEDWHYSRLLAQKGLFFGVLDGYADHIGAADSARLLAQRELYGPRAVPHGLRRIAIDVRTVEPHMHGIGVYAHRLVRALAAVAPHIEFLVLVSPQGEGLFGGMPPNVRAVRCPVPLGDRRWEEAEGERWCLANGVGLYHGTSYGCIASGRLPSVATIHDVSFMTHPHFYEAGFAGHMRSELDSTLGSGAHVITVSEHVRGILKERFGLPEDRVTAVHSGPGQFDEEPPNQRTRDHILAMDLAQPRKNAEGVVAAFGLLLQRLSFEGRLRFVEKGWHVRPELQERCRQIGILDRVEVTGELDPSALADAYVSALCLVYPSCDEGFGFPPLEAMQCGTPVVTSRAGSLPELCGDAALYADPGDAPAIAEAMRRIACEPGLAGEMAERGRRRVQGFSWEKCARETLAVYHAAAEQWTPPRQRVVMPSPRVPSAGAVGMVTTWNVPCGVAESTRSVVDALRADRPVHILSELHEGPAEDDEHPCWSRAARSGRAGDLSGIVRAARESGCSIVHVQYHPAFFYDPDAFSWLLWDLKASGIATVVTLHELSGAPPVWCLVPDLLICHSRAMREHLVHGNITTPLSVVPMAVGEGVRDLKAPDPDSRVVLKTVGFLHPDRGHRQALEAVARLSEHFDVEYQAVGAPARGCEGYPEELRACATELGISDRFSLRVGYLPREDLISEWRGASIGLLPYSYRGIGSSGAVLDALSAGVPLVTSRSVFFSDLDGAVRQADSAEEMTAEVEGILTAPKTLEDLARARSGLLEDRTPRLRAERHERAYAQVLARRLRTGRTALTPWISLHIVARETTRFGMEMYRSCLRSLKGYPDEFVIVDNGCSEEVRRMAGEELSGSPVRWIRAPEVHDFSVLRNLALEHTSPAATHVHWVDTDEVFFPNELPRIREALRDPDISAMHVLLVHFMREPTLVQDVQVNRCIFRKGERMHWRGMVHEVLEGLPRGRSSFLPVRFLHFGYCRPQWETCLKWLQYAALEHGSLDMYRWETVDGQRRPWFGERRTPDTILEDRPTAPYEGRYPASCAPWLEAWHSSGLPWREYLRRLVDHAPWERWRRLAQERGNWEATLEEMLGAPQTAATAP